MVVDAIHAPQLRLHDLPSSKLKLSYFSDIVIFLAIGSKFLAVFTAILASNNFTSSIGK
jgi:hypothetical protein